MHTFLRVAGLAYRARFRVRWVAVAALVCGLSLPLARAGIPSGYMEYYVPCSEDQIFNVFDDINNMGNQNMRSVIAVTAMVDGVTLYYDHWENGYTFDPADPVATSDLQITLSEGQVQQWDNVVPLAFTGGTAGTRPINGPADWRFDGRDRIYTAGGGVTVTRAAWPVSRGAVQGVCWEVYPTKPFLTAYTIPVGENLQSAGYDDFTNTYVLVQSTTDGNTVILDDPGTALSPDVTVTLDRGEVTQLWHIDSGTTITSTSPVQVQVIVGDPSPAYQVRGISMVPVGLWSDEYYNPVSGPAPYETDLYIYNPQPTPITIEYADSVAPGGGTFTVAAGATIAYSNGAAAGRFVPNNSGVILRSQGGEVFWTVGTADAEGGTYDWAFALVPDYLLTEEYYLGWAPGSERQPNPTENGSPVYVTPVANNTTIYVDYSPTDGVIDATFGLDRLQTVTIRDPDNDNTGMRVWGTGPFAAVWGIRSNFATSSFPYLDMGYTTLPIPPEFLDVVLTVDKTPDPEFLPTAAGQTVTFTVDLATDAYEVQPIANALIDELPASFDYVPRTARIRRPNGTTVNYPESEPSVPSAGVLAWSRDQLLGFGVTTLTPNETVSVVFDVVTTAAFSEGDVSVNRATAQAERTVGGATQTFITWDNAFNRFTDTYYTASGQVREDTDGDGSLADPDLGIADALVQLWTDPNVDGDEADGRLFASTRTDPDGAFQLNGIPDGDYVLLQVDAAGTRSTADSSGANDNRVPLTIAGANSTGNAFLDTPAGVLTGQVSEDTDGSGDFSGSDTALAGVTVTLITDPNGDGDPADGTTVATTQTDVDGFWTFDDVQPGDYVVEETDPAGAASVTDVDPPNDNRVAVAIGIGATVLGIDFLDRNANRSAIFGQVRDDADGDGDPNDPDTGISGVTLTLYSDPDGDGDPADGVVIATATTDGGGSYSFDDLTDGDYVVVQTNPTGFAATYDADGDADNRIAVTLSSGAGGNTFLSAAQGSVSGRVREDTAGDDALNGNEPGIAGVILELWSDPDGDGDPADGVRVATVGSDVLGDYQFTGVSPGDYVVVQRDPPLATSDDDADGTAANSTNEVAVTVSPGGTVTAQDFLDDNIVLSAVTGQLRDDGDGDGDLADGDAGINGVTLELWTDPNGDGDPADGALVASTVTANDGLNDGAYTFPNIAAANLTIVQVDLATYASTADAWGENDNRIAISLAGAGAAGNDFLDALRGAVAGTVWDDVDGSLSISGGDAGIDGVTVQLWQDTDGDTVLDTLVDSAVTAGGGAYAFTDVAPGAYTVVQLDPSNAASILDVDGAPDNRIPVTLAPSGAITGRDFLDRLRIFGSYSDSGHGTASDAFARDPDGAGAGTDTIYVGGTGWTASTDFVVAYYDREANLVYTDTGAASDGTGELFSTNPNTNDTVTYGIWTAVVLPDGATPLLTLPAQLADASTLGSDTFTVTSLSVATFTDENGTPVAAYPLQADASVYVEITDRDRNLDPGLVETITVTVTDPATGDSETVTLYETGLDTGIFADDVTGSRLALPLGTGAAAADGTLQVLGGTTIQVDYTDAAAGDAASDTARINAVTVSGQVRNDTDGDGDLTDAEAGLSNVAIELWSDPDGDGDHLDDGVLLDATVSDPNGNYIFNDVPDGDLVVVAADAPAFASTGDAMPPNDNRVPLTIAGAAAGNADFLDAQAATVTGQVVADSDASGDFSGADTGLGGVLLQLWTDPDGDGDPTDGAVVATTATDAGGVYTFTAGPGDYVVVEIDPTGAASIDDAQGPPADNRVAVTLGVGITRAGADFLDDAGAAQNSVSGTVYDDADGSGDFTLGELGLAGATIAIWSDPNGDGDPSDGVAIDSRVTAIGGTFTFSDLTDGTYVLVSTDPAGYASTGDTDGSGDGDNRVAITVAGADLSGLTFFDAARGTVSGTVWEDTVDNDTIDGGDTGLPGVNVSLWNDPNGNGDPTDDGETAPVLTTATDATGAYSFPDIGPGQYVLVETDPAGATSDADVDGGNPNWITVVLTPGATLAGRDFLDDGVVRSTVSGQVRDDLDGDGDPSDLGDPERNGVTVSLYTDPNGDGDPADGVLVTTTITAGLGEFTFAALPDGTYVVVQVDGTGTVSTGDPDGTNDSRTGITLSGADVPDLVFLDAAVSTVAGVVYDDADGDNTFGVGDAFLAGVTLQLWQDVNGDSVLDLLVDETVSGVAGDYLFADVAPGAFVIVEVDPADAISVTDADGINDNRIAVTLTPGDALAGNRFLDRVRSLESYDVTYTVVDDRFNRDPDGAPAPDATEPIYVGGSGWTPTTPFDVAYYDRVGDLVYTDVTAAADGTGFLRSVNPNSDDAVTYGAWTAVVVDDGVAPLPTLAGQLATPSTLAADPFTVGAWSTVAFTDAAGFGANTYFYSGTAYLRVIDRDRNTDPGVVETITVTVTNPRGDSETLTLYETDIDTGVFTDTAAGALLPLPLANNPVDTAGDGTLQVLDGDTIQVAYADVADPADSAFDPADISNSAFALSAAATPSATIGDTVAYQLALTVNPSATTQAVQIVDTLPADFRYDGGGVTLGYGAGITVANDPPTVVWDGPTRQLTITLGDVGNTNGAPATVLVNYGAVVENSANNNAGDTKTNAAVASATGEPARAADADIAIIEPRPTIVKDVENVTPCDVAVKRKLPWHAPDQNDTLRYAVTLTNSGASAADAFDLDLVDTLDADLSFVAGSAALVVGNTSFTANFGQPAVAGQTLSWGRGQGVDLDLAVGDTVIFTYDVTVITAAADEPVDNGLVVDWTSVDGLSADERSGSLAPAYNDLTAAEATLDVRTWSEPAAIDVAVDGAVARDGATAYAGGPLTGRSLLNFTADATVTVTGDGIPNEAEPAGTGDPRPFGRPSVTVQDGIAATIDASSAFVIDRLIIGQDASLTLQGGIAYTIGTLTMAQNSRLVVPNNSAITVAGVSALTGGVSRAVEPCVIEPATGGGNYSITFECDFTASRVHFKDLGTGTATFRGATDISIGTFTGGNGGGPYLAYEFAGNNTWDRLAFEDAGGKNTIDSITAAGDITVDVYENAPGWIGGEATSQDQNDDGALGDVVWSNATPVFALTGAVSAAPEGGVLVTWETGIEDAVLRFLVERHDGREWVAVGNRWPRGSISGGASYGFLDHTAEPGLACRYRLAVVDFDGSEERFLLGAATAIAKAEPPPEPAVALPVSRSELPAAEVTAPVFAVTRHATDTPTQEGTAAKATVTTAGLYATGGTVFNLGRRLPALDGGLVFVRGFEDFYADANVVWNGDLTVTGEPGTPPPLPIHGVLSDDGFTGLFRVEVDGGFSVNPNLPPGPNWYFPDSYDLDGAANVDVTVPVRAPLPGRAVVEIGVRGNSDAAHDLVIAIGRQDIGQQEIARATWSGNGYRRVRATFDAGLLQDGDNTVTLTTSGADSSKRLDYVEIQTPATPILRDDDTGLTVRIDSSAGDGPLTVAGARYAVDAGSFGSERLLTMDGDTLTAPPSGATVHFAAAAAPLTWSDPVTLTAPDFSEIDYLAVVPETMAAELAPLLAARDTDGLRTALLTLETVTDVYGSGVYGPAGIVRLAATARPDYLLLAAGTTYDYKGLEGGDVPPGIPTGFVHVNEGLAASDDLYSNAQTTAVGRLPARSADELAVMVAKTVAYVPGRRAVLLSGRDYKGENRNDRFRTMQAALAGILPTAVIHATDRSNSDVRDDLIDAVQMGARLVAYQGHAGYQELGQGIFTADHVGSLPPAAWILSTCLTGSYIVNDASLPVLSHRLMASPATGGALVLCSTRYGEMLQEDALVREALTLMATRQPTWGAVLTKIKKALAPSTTIDVYTLLGDPALPTVDLDESRELQLLAPGGGAMINHADPITVRLALGGEGWWDERLRLSWSRNGSRAATFAELAVEPGKTAYELDWTPPNDGDGYQITVEEITGDSALRAVSGRFAVDRMPPYRVSSDPAAGALVVGDAPLLTVTADDAVSGVEAYRFQVDDTVYDWQSGRALQLTQWAPGEHRWRTAIRDRAGNETGWSDWLAVSFNAGDDTDDDDLPDAWELLYFGSLDRTRGLADWDRDGFDDREELLAGTHPYEFAIDLQAGWNLLALPFDATPQGIADLIAVSGRLWAWQGQRWRRQDLPRAHEGFWVYVDDAVSGVPVAGIPVDEPWIALSRGWNLTGAGQQAYVIDPGPAVVAWDWTAGRYRSLPIRAVGTELAPFRGYWLYSRKSGELWFTPAEGQ